MSLATQIVIVAESQVGVEEENGTNCGKIVNLYKSATNLPPDEAWPWCAAFVDWCVREAMTVEGIEETATFRRPRTAGAWDLENWSLRQDDTTQTKRAPDDDIQPGDIVIFRFSHVGIAVASPDGGTVETVEGNTDAEGSREGGGVFRKVRRLAQIKTRIRFTV